MANKTNSADHWVSLGDVADQLKISHEAARRLVHRGTLPHRRVRPDGWSGNSKIEVPAASVVALANSPRYLSKTRRGRSS